MQRVARNSARVWIVLPDATHERTYVGADCPALASLGGGAKRTARANLVWVLPLPPGAILPCDDGKVSVRDASARLLVVKLYRYLRSTDSSLRSMPAANSALCVMARDDWIAAVVGASIRAQHGETLTIDSQLLTDGILGNHVHRDVRVRPIIAKATPCTSQAGVVRRFKQDALRQNHTVVSVPRRGKRGVVNVPASLI